MNNQIAMLQQIMKSPNKTAMVENMIKQNPQMNNAWEMAQKLSTGNRQQVITEIARQKGMNIEDIQQLAKNFGISI